jgi:hypothetical protein
MNLYRPVFIVTALLLTVSFLLISQRSYAQAIIPNAHDYIEDGNTHRQYAIINGSSDYIYGTPRQIITARIVTKSSDKKHRLFIDSITYNNHGNIIKSHLGICFTNSDFSYSKYFDKYDPNIKKITSLDDTTNITRVHTFDKTGRDVITYHDKDGAKQFAVYQYDAVNNLVTESFFYRTKKVIGLRETYRYNSKNLLSEIDDYSNEDKIEERVLFTYQLFDTHGNWTKRTETRKNSKSIVTGIVTTTRKITYY